MAGNTWFIVVSSSDGTATIHEKSTHREAEDFINQIAQGIDGRSGKIEKVICGMEVTVEKVETVTKYKLVS